MSGKTFSPVRRLILIAAFVVCLGVFLFSGYQIISIIRESNTSAAVYDTVIQTAVKDAAENIPEAEEELVLPSVDFGALKKQNSETIGWIYSKGTPIHYPVVRAKDNEKYLDTLFNGGKSKYGAIFADYRCKTNDCPVLILYGHHMKNGTMFASLTKYKKQEYYNEHPVVYYIDDSGVKYEVKLFAGRVLDGFDTAAYPLSFENEAAFNSFISKTKSKSRFASDVVPKYSDRLLILSTCSYETKNSRFAVYGVMSPIN